MIAAGDAANAMGGRLVAGDPGYRLAKFSIDSRSIEPGALFFAIRGERFDGHEFVQAAVAAGAAGVVTSEPVAVEPPVLSIRVADTTRALQALARHVRRLSGAKVVAVTGSAGKTTTKEAAARFLSAKYRVFRNAGNLNNHIGLPLSLLELVDEPEIAVVELGMNHPGEIRLLSEIAGPDVRVWTNVSEVHTAFFESLDAVADAKAEILENARPGDVLVANCDDPLVMARASRFRGKTVTFGFGGDATVSARAVESLGLDGMRGTLVTPDGEASFRIGLLGRTSVANVLAAAAAAWSLGIEPREIAERAALVSPANHRGVVLSLSDGITVVDDSYNSNPKALGAMLEIVGGMSSRRRVGVLGEMLELANTIERHRDCGREAARALDVLVAVGGEAARALQAAAAESMAPESVSWVETSREAADRVIDLVRPGDVVLVKGSRGIRTEVVVERLQAELG